MKIKRAAFLFVLLLITHLSPSSIQNNKKNQGFIPLLFYGQRKSDSSTKSS
jgi:hypothetical protein